MESENLPAAAGTKRIVEQIESRSDEAVLCQPCEESERKVKRVAKRANALPWDDYFMSVAFLSAMRSKDPSTQVGACIVNEERRIVGIGYNGFPKGCSDDDLPWDREADNELDTKYPVSLLFHIHFLVIMSTLL